MATNTIDALLDRARHWSAGAREGAAEVLLDLEDASAEWDLTEEQYADLDEAIAEADRGEFATDEEVEAVFARYRR